MLVGACGRQLTAGMLLMYVVAPAPVCRSTETPVCPMCVYASNADSCRLESIQEDCSDMYHVSSPVKHETIELHL